MLLAKGTSGFFPPDNTDMDMHKHGQRAMQAEKTEWKNSLKFMYCERRDIYNVRILEADQYKIKKDLKEQFTQKLQFCHYLLTLLSFQTCMNFFPLQNLKGKSLRNMLVIVFFANTLL